MHHLARGFPNCAWDILAPPPACEILEGNPAIRAIHRFDLPPGPGSREFEMLRARRYDVAICYDSGMYLRPLRLAVDLGIPNRVGYVHKGFSVWVTHPVQISYPMPFPGYFRDLVSQLTGESPTWPLIPIIGGNTRSTQPEQAQSAGVHLACFPATRQPGAECVSDAIARTLAAFETLAPNAKTMLLGSASELDMIGSLKGKHGLRAEILTPPLPLKELVAFLSGCRAVLSADSGPRHLANAAGTKVFFLRNLASDTTETGRYLDSETDLLADTDSCWQATRRRRILDGFDTSSAASTIFGSLFPAVESTSGPSSQPHPKASGL